MNLSKVGLTIYYKNIFTAKSTKQHRYPDHHCWSLFPLAVWRYLTIPLALRHVNQFTLLCLCLLQFVSYGTYTRVCCPCWSSISTFMLTVMVINDRRDGRNHAKRRASNSSFYSILHVLIITNLIDQWLLHCWMQIELFVANLVMSLFYSNQKYCLGNSNRHQQISVYNVAVCIKLSVGKTKTPQVLLISNFMSRY